MGSIQEKRIRHGELHTKAWNPKISKQTYASIKLADESVVELRPLKLTQDFIDDIKGLSPGVSQMRMYAMGEWRVVVTIDITQEGRVLHVSCVGKDQWPTWEMMIGLKRIFYPEDVAAILLMPESEPYGPIGYYALHLWQLPASKGQK